MADLLLDRGYLRPEPRFTDPQEIIRINDLKLEANEAMLKVRYGRYILYFLGVMNLLYGVGMFSLGQEEGAGGDWFLLYGSAFMALLYGGLGTLTFRRPLLGLMMGLGLYALDHALVMMDDPTRAFEGLFVKIGILTGFGFAIMGCFRLRELLGRLQDLGLPEEELRLGRKLQDMPRTPQV